MKARPDLITALDIGTTKISCCIARTDPQEGITVLGVGQHLSKGLRGGSIIDMEALETSILNAVHSAEQMAGETIHQVVVNLSNNQVSSKVIRTDIPIAGNTVEENDIRQIFNHLRLETLPSTSEVIHTIPISYQIDHDRGIRDPRGMFGKTLSATTHLVTAPISTVRNLATCVGRCHLDIANVVASAYASGLSVLVEDEAELGVIVIDMGGGTTTFGAFNEGMLIATDTISLGGTHVTNDIARGLSTTVSHAERLKTLYGNAIVSTEDEREIVTIPQVGETSGQPPLQISKAALARIIQPRLEEIFEMLRQRIEALGLSRLAGRNLVLTGGASQLPGIRELAASILDRNIRLGKPLNITPISDIIINPAFATCAGLISYAYNEHKELARQTETSGSSLGFIKRIGSWIKDNF